MFIFLVCFIPSLLVTLGLFIWHRYQYDKSGKGTNYRSYMKTQEVTLKEFLISCGLTVILAAVSLGINNMVRDSGFIDTKYIHGVVTEKYKDSVSCEHSYQICTTSNKTTTCTTYYEHFEDYDWVVKTTAGNLTIDRVDRQGSSTPPRWKSVVIGEYATQAYNYMNYLKNDKHTLFKANASGGAGIPQPRIYDYYRFSPVIGFPEIEEQVKQYNSRSNLNVNYVVVTGKNRDFIDSIVKDWEGVDINQILIVINLEKSNTVGYIRVATYANGYKNQYLIKDIEDSSIGKPVNNQLVTEHFSKIKSDFTRIPKDEFIEKKEEYRPSLGLIIFLVLLNLAVSIVTHIYMKRNPVA